MELNSFLNILNCPAGINKINAPELTGIQNYLLDQDNQKEIIFKHLKYFLENPEFSNVQLLLDGEDAKIDQVEFVKDMLKSKNIFESIKQSPCSIKLAGIQNSDPFIKQFSHQIYSKYKIPLFSNMYITPPGNKPCYTYHVDPHKVFFIHIQGKKTWFFPKENEHEYVFFPEVFEFNENQNFSKVEEIDVVPGDSFCISKGIVHRAYNQTDENCIHVTFPMNQPDQFYLLKLYYQTIMDFTYEEIQRIEEMDDLICMGREIKNILQQKINSISESQILNAYLTKEKMKNLYIIKNGRPYSKIANDTYKRIFF